MYYGKLQQRCITNIVLKQSLMSKILSTNLNQHQYNSQIKKLTKLCLSLNKKPILTYVNVSKLPF